MDRRTLVDSQPGADRRLRRAGRGERYTGHFDLDALPDVRAGPCDGRYDLTGLGHPFVSVGTDDGYHTESGAILDHARGTTRTR
jgi:hypothetical protein